ncbi:uncharacterized protein HMPREF1541_09798 [Cyphellophora europaea CBS 101466]|uniref:Uncharacterized protein n=1 Tax=Cyphellophora europaea (strain CBS 101466) TaxID=1220924 RepID=W2SA87_CYPE1|nr:uncharacterized protein HMPREF1541_09798 [Cyphellophora europaea CBS 101466]ETN44923.1 hypothetical protein HMPREF1541_09798 [Cyphellophora europaea CBS 101466]
MDVPSFAAFQSSTRQARGAALNTIKEESEYGTLSDSDGSGSGSGSGSDGTVIGKPAGWNPRMYVAAPRKTSKLSYVTSSSPVSSAGTSPHTDNNEDFDRRRRSSNPPSESGTIFSEESCPSLASDPTTFVTNSSRNSVASSTKSARNRYPALLIPRGSWQDPVKEVALGMSPTAKFVLSPEALSTLSRQLPADNAPPSLGSSSAASQSPCLPGLSLPGTPDSRQLDVVEGEAWGQPENITSNPLEITVDEEHSIMLSPQEAHGPRSAIPLPAGLYQSLPSAREREWGEMVTRFPTIPGATPQSNDSPFPMLKGTRKDMLRTESGSGSESGVMLPGDALRTLQRITRAISPDELSDCSKSLRDQEMRERSEGGSYASRRRSLDDMTPATEGSFAKLSEYSFTQLSIPSPGGFFSSLQAGSRQTWCMNRSVNNSVPTSAVAEKFYYDWTSRGEIRESTVTVADSSSTDGPPTARQPVFNIDSTKAGANGSHPAGASHDRNSSVSTSSEDADMYGPGDDGPTFAAPTPIEYEEAYEEELKQAGEQNLGRTSNWLAAQTSYLSALRETNPVNDPADYAPSPSPFHVEDDNPPRRASIESQIRKTVRFLEEAKTVGEPAGGSLQSSGNSSPNEQDERNPVFHAAFSHFVKNIGEKDAFLAAGTRLDGVRANRIANPSRHIDSLFGRMNIEVAARPKYSGPFAQNPRATGIFERTEASLAYEVAEREQRAMACIQASAWQVEALRATYNGRLFASRVADERLKLKATLPLSDPACIGNKRIRVLDLGGESNASWGWSAAHEFPNVKVYTVLTKTQAACQRPPGEPKPEAPENHRTVSVPHLWQLPFKNNHFDMISARSLHALLKANPVPGAPEIDEWTMTLKECMRILKPGGYIDFIVMDSSVARAGPRGEALSVEFGFDLHRRGYEREPARSWLRRLKKEGFVATKRAWMFWPMGRRPDAGEADQGARAFIPAPRPVSEVSTISKIVKQYMDVEAVQGPVGSTQDAADITGLLGTRMYEEWLVKVRKEAGREDVRLLEGIDEVLEEGKSNGGGFRVLVGWARKPRPASKAPEMEEKGREVSPVNKNSPLKEVITIAIGGDVKGDAGNPLSAESREGEIPMMMVA